MEIDKKSTHKKRKYTRFEPEMGTLAFIDPVGEGKFRPTIAGLLVEEAYGGGCIVSQKKALVRKGQKVKIKAGKLAPMLAIIRWVEKPDPRIRLIGFEFIE